MNTNLNFYNYVSQLYKKAKNKLHASARIATYMDITKRLMLKKAFVSSQLSYCPLMWIFHSRKMEHTINSVR